MLIMVGLVIIGFIGYNRKYGKKGGKQDSNKKEE